MDKVHILNQLRVLSLEGKILLDSDNKDVYKFISWYHQVGECIRQLLGDRSFILSGFEKIIPGEPLIDVEEKKLPELTKLVLSSINSVLEGQQKNVEIDSNHIKDEVTKYIHQFLMESKVTKWLLAILIISVAFAVLGIIQINFIKFDINEYTDKKIAELKEELQTINQDYVKKVKKHSDIAIEEIDSLTKSTITDLSLLANNNFSAFVEKEKVNLAPVLREKIDNSLLSLGTIDSKINDLQHRLEIVDTLATLSRTTNIMSSELKRDIPYLIKQYNLYNNLAIAIIILLSLITICIITLIAYKIKVYKPK